MNGYFNHNMCNGAVNAYARGAKPKSHWSKADMLTGITELAHDENLSLDIGLVSKLTKNELQDNFLRCVGIYYTSLHLNKTPFFTVSVSISNIEIQNIILNRIPIKRKPRSSKLAYADVVYYEWTASQKHPKLQKYTAQAVLNNTWAYILPDGKKKRIQGKNFLVEKLYKRRPVRFDIDDVNRIKKIII